jgi:hypothetical protein
MSRIVYFDAFFTANYPKTTDLSYESEIMDLFGLPVHVARRGVCTGKETHRHHQG